VDVEALELLGAAVSLALDNAAAYADQQQAAERLAAIDQPRATSSSPPATSFAPR
jgi:GAF domain-containing protein